MTWWSLHRTLILVLRPDTSVRIAMFRMQHSVGCLAQRARQYKALGDRLWRYRDGWPQYARQRRLYRGRLCSLETRGGTVQRHVKLAAKAPANRERQRSQGATVLPIRVEHISACACLCLWHATVTLCEFSHTAVA